LGDEIRRNGRARIGLFHSGSGEVHLATVDAVVAPEADEYGSYLPVGPPEVELEMVPEYYRQSRYSRAWLRLVSISSSPVSFFGEFSYLDPPELPRHARSQLAQLAGKRIVDADELRAMDTTIWSVRPSFQNDPSTHFLAASARLDEAISARPVECQGEWLLHITDPHYALGSARGEHRWRLESESGAAPPTMVDAINEALVRTRRSVGAVLVTGDLTYVGSRDEFEAARLGIFKLTNGLLALGTEHLVVIPGNHDIVWTKQGSYEDDAHVEVAPHEATKNYRDFFKALYLYDASPHLSMARRLVLPGGYLVDIVAVNSSSLEQGRSFLAGMGRVQEAGFREASGALSWDKSKGLSLRIIALHHHLALTEDLESPSEYGKGFGIAVDAPRVQRMAVRSGVHLAMHGHKHREFVWRTGVYELPEYSREKWDLGSINILGGGSAGSTSTDGGRNFFNLLRFNGSTLELEMYTSHAGGSFERFMTWQAEFAPDPPGHRLALGPWTRTDRP
jgi:hypothetical protein